MPSSSRSSPSRIVRAITALDDEVVDCRRCDRLVAWREQVAVDKRAAFRGDEYWGRPVPTFGDPNAKVLVVGLAPAAHGANRTGRMFTGDRSGDFLFASLYRTGFASQPTSSHVDDGLRLHDLSITAAVRCAPPDNKPSPTERDNCATYLDRELAIRSSSVRVYVVLGAFGYDALWAALGRRDLARPSRKPRFGHAAEVEVGGQTIVCSFHPSQQNTFTGRLTEPMLDAIFLRVRELLGAGESPA